MKIKVNLISDWSPTKSGKGKFCKAVYLDLDSVERVFGVVLAAVDSAQSAPANDVLVNLRSWGPEEYNGVKRTRFMGGL